jgi:hypothetical protein
VEIPSPWTVSSIMTVDSSVEEDVDPSSSVVFFPSQSLLDRLSTQIVGDRLTTFLPPHSTMNFLTGPTALARSMLALLKPAKEDPDWADGTQVLNVSYGQVYNCLCCRKGGITDLQHFTRCPSYLEHKKYCKAAFAHWKMRRRDAQRNNFPFTEVFRPPHPGKFFDRSKKPLKANERMVAPTLVRAYPGESGYGAYQTLCSTVAPSPQFFPNEFPETPGHASYHGPFVSSMGQTSFPYAPGQGHPFPLGTYDAPDEAANGFGGAMLGRDQTHYMNTVGSGANQPYSPNSMFNQRLLAASGTFASTMPVTQFPLGSYQNPYGAQSPHGGHWVSNVPSGETTFSGQASASSESVEESQASSVKEKPKSSKKKKVSKKKAKPVKNRKAPPRGNPPHGGPPSSATRSAGAK